MRVLGVIFSFILLIGAGREYAHASRELGTFTNPGVLLAIFVFLFFCTWLLGGSLSKRKLKIISLDYVKYLIISLVTFSFFAFLSLISQNIPKNIVEINGYKIAIDDIDRGSKNLFPDAEDREEYCLCIAEKLAYCEEITSKYKNELERGELDKIMTEVQNKDFFLELGIDECMMNSNIVWTDNFANGMVRTWKQELIGSDFENTNDVDIYCNCLIELYKQQPLNFILSDGFMESEFARKADVFCTETSDLENFNIDK